MPYVKPTREEFQTYYHTKFASHLQFFLDNYRGNDDPARLYYQNRNYRFYLFAQAKYEVVFPDGDLSAKDACLFVSCMFYVAAITRFFYIAGHEFGVRNENPGLFNECTGWPLISAGMGGCLPAMQIVGEMNIIPYSKESGISVADCIEDNRDFMVKEITDFMLGKEQALASNPKYARFVDIYGDSTEDMADVIDRQIAEMKEICYNHKQIVKDLPRRE